MAIKSLNKPRQLSRMLSLLFIGLSSTAVLHGDGSTIVSGCVKDASGSPVKGAKIVAVPELSEKTYRAETRKADGCYEMKIGNDDVYGLGVRDDRFTDNGPIQKYITVSGLDLPNVDLSTAVPDKKLLRSRMTDAVLSASEAFARVRRGIRLGNIPVITGEVPSGFLDCMLQSSDDGEGPTAMWWCSTDRRLDGIRDEKAAHAIFQVVRESITTALSELEQLRYSPMNEADGQCSDCVDRAVWISPINGAISLSQTKDKKRNALVLWAAYNSKMTEDGCAAIQMNQEPKVDLARYDAAVKAMRDEYLRQMDDLRRAALSNIFGAAIGGPAFIGSMQQPGVTVGSRVLPNACLKPGVRRYDESIDVGRTSEPTRTAPSVTKIYLYRSASHLFGTSLNPTVSLDGKEAARWEKGEFFSMVVTTGRHRVSLRSGWGPPADIDIKPGQQYFIKFRNQLEIVDPSVAIGEIKKLKPIDPKHIRDNKRVVVVSAAEIEGP